jgi:two-component SAPR family response regulator
LRNRELIGRIKGQNPDLMEVPDAELWEALLGQKQKMVSEGKLIEGLWAEINP